MMDEQDLWCILVLLGLLTVGSILQSRTVRVIGEAVIEQQNDIDFLKQALKAMDERVD